MLKIAARCRVIHGRTTPCLARLSVRHLPVCTVDTNLKESEVPSDFAAKFSKVISETLNKSEAVSSEQYPINIHCVMYDMLSRTQNSEL